MAGNYDHLLRPIVDGWLGKIDEAAKHKRKHFQDTADQCMQFFCGTMDFFYSPEYQQKYLGGAFNPKFRISINKAFELVANFLPVIYDRNPTREVYPNKGITFGPEIFGDPNDPNVQMQHQFAVQQEQIRKGVSDSGCQTVEKYLNYTPDEQPNGGLKQASEDACTEALVKGRGVLFTEAYQMPDSDRILTGSFYDTVDRLYVDPDAESVNFGEAMWIAREIVEPVWKVERDRGLPVGSLKNKQSGYESAESRGASSGRHDSQKKNGTTFDMLRYYKIWSIGGIGSRFTGMVQGIQNTFDDIVGDYAYLEIARGVPWPLNFPADRLETATEEDAKVAFAWPIPYWKDSRWPMVILDFYRKPNSSWPISPLAPGLGELIALNIIISRLTYNIYQNTRTIIAVLQSAQKQVEAALRSSSDEVIVAIPEILKDIDSLIKWIHGPGVTADAWQIVDRLFALFDKRVGLNDLFSMNPGATPRVSADAETKRHGLSIRPDYLSSKVEGWQSEVARNEMVCAYFAGVNGQSVRPLLGDIGAAVFDRAFSNADSETVLREMNCRITAGSAQKPNKAQDAANLKEVYQPMSIQLGQVAAQTGDYTKLDKLNERLGESMQLDLKDLAIGQLQPPQPEGQGPPPPDPVAEAKAQSEQQKTQIKMAGQQQNIALQSAKQQQDMAIQAAKAKQELTIQAATARQRMVLQQAEQQQKAQHENESHNTDMLMTMARDRLARMSGNARTE